MLSMLSASCSATCWSIDFTDLVSTGFASRRNWAYADLNAGELTYAFAQAKSAVAASPRAEAGSL
jgi:hypothetical protein